MAALGVLIMKKSAAGVLGDRDSSKNEVLKRWEKLAHRMVRKNIWRLRLWYDYDDLLNHAREAIWRAHIKYDPANAAGANFQTFARTVMTNAFNALHHYVRADMRRDRVRDVSADLVNPDGSQVFQFPSPDDAPDAGLIRDCEKATIDAAIASLPARDRRIILDRLRDRTLKEVGDDTDLTRERVRQLERLALRRLLSVLAASFPERGRRASPGPLSLNGSWSK